MQRNLLLPVTFATLMIGAALLGRNGFIPERSADAVFWMLLGLAAGMNGSHCLRLPRRREA